jgi:hypothetical protein
MTTSLITTTAVLIGVGALLAVWKAGRIVIFESLAHPLTKSIIHIRPDGKVASVERVVCEDRSKVSDTEVVKKRSHHVVAS